MNYRIPIIVFVLSLYTASGSEEVTDTETTKDDSLNRVRRSGFSMLRLGRGLQMLRLGKRALPMLRMGRSAGDSLSDDDVEYLLNLMRNDRQVPLPRYGKDLTLQYMLMNALRNAELSSTYDDEVEPDLGFGYDLELTPSRQIRPAPRPGRFRRSADTEAKETKSTYAGGDQVYEDIKDLDSSEEKYDGVRVAPLMRYGKFASYEQDDENDVDKRAMRMLRLGRGMRMLRLGKRPDESEELTEADKRALRLLRLGKRPAFAMLRMGRSDLEEDKRALRLLRLGKKSETEEAS